VVGAGAAVIVERAGNALVLRASGVDPTCRRIAATIVAEPFTAPLVVDASAQGALRELDPNLIDRIGEQLHGSTFGSPSDVRLVPRCSRSNWRSR